MKATKPARDLPSSVTQPHFLEDCPKWRVPGVQWHLQGHSQAGERTGFWIPELKLFLDAGVNSYKNPDTILITHGHGDHSFGTPFLAMGQGGVLAKRPHVYIPRDASGPLQLFCRAAQSLNDCRELTPDAQIRCHPTTMGDTFSVCNSRVEVNVVQCVHRVPTVGYILSTVSKKLKPEFQGLPGKEIGRLSKTTEVSQRVATPRVCFMGDTTIEAFKLTPSVRTACGGGGGWGELMLCRGIFRVQILKCPVVVVECTLLHARDESKAWSSGHICWSQLRPIAKGNPDVTFVLIHFSRKYRDEDIARFFDALPGGHPANVVLFLDSGIRTSARS